MSIIALVLVLIGLLALALQRFYSCVPAKELKRLAAREDHLAMALYRPVAYGESMRLLLWMVFGASLTAGFVLFCMALVTWIACLMIGLSLAVAVVVQSLRLTVRSARVAVTAAPALSWLLNYVHTPFDVITHFINRHRLQDGHSGLYEKEDIIALLRQQKEQPDNRIGLADLEMLERVATFDDQQAADIAVVMSHLKLVNIEDHIGPVLLGELHNSGESSFLVYQDSTDHVVGTLLLRDAVRTREGGRVADIMRPSLNYVHEDFTLRQVLEAFMRTAQTVLVVVNSFEEAVGVISLQQLLVHLFGDEIARDEFTAYEDRAAVAAFKPEPEPTVQVDDSKVAEPEPVAEEPTADQAEAQTSALSSPESTEMVE